MAQRNSYSKKNGRTNKKPSSSKNASPQYGHKKGNGGNIGWVLLLIVVIAAGVMGVLYLKDLNSDGASAKSSNPSNLTQEEATTIVETAADDVLSKVSVTFRYGDKSWNFGADDLQATIDVQKVLAEASQSGNVLQDYQSQQDTQTLSLMLSKAITVDRQALVDALSEVQKEIDNPVVEPTIVFDPSEYDYFEDKNTPDVDMSRDMFTLTEGQIGYKMDYDDALQQLSDALSMGWTAEVTLKVVEAYPTITKDELEECTTLVFHSFSKISSDNKKDSDRTHNIRKAIGFYKGLVLMPGEIISYNETLGERTKRSGWLEANTINQEKMLEKALGGGICQAATTIFNAAYMANANVTNHHPHSWPAYYNDFGYGMDAMVNWPTHDLIFKNDTEYPIFFNTYFWYDTYGVAGYVDVDVYTMPQKDAEENILHIRPEYKNIETLDPEQPIYQEVGVDEYLDLVWTLDSEKNKMVATLREARPLKKYSVDKVWYKDCVEAAPGVFEGGVEVDRKYSHTYTYKSFPAIILTKPVPVATPTPEPTPDGGASG
ncbi:MAG: VanW family protein [Clostridiales bacterium]|nr:VanW family protein [Clostridiales bacterium]